MRSQRAVRTALSLLLIASAAVSSARAQAPTPQQVAESEAEQAQTAEDAEAEREGFGPRLHWPSEWGRWNAADIAVTSVGAAATVAFQLIGPRQTNNWDSTTGIDDRVRGWLRADSRRARNNFRDASDLLLSFSVSYPFLFDGLVTSWWYHRSPEVGRQLALTAVEVQFVVAAIQSITNVAAARIRPFVQECEPGGDIPEDDEICHSGNRFRSFFSGHTSQAFAGAATSCVYHAKLPLYGGGAPEVLSCVGAMGAAALTGIFRITGDMHHATDVITGAIVGTGVGLLIPMLRMRAQRRWETPIVVMPMGAGLMVMGALQ